MRTRSQPHRPDPQKSLVGFIVGEVCYAIDISVVREIVNPLSITPLPHTPPEVAGVSDHRGEVVPVIDLRVRFGLEPAMPSRSTKWILVDGGTSPIGLIVDAVTEVFGTGGAELRPTPQVGGSHDARGFAGVTSHNGALTFVLDTDRFLEVLRVLEARGVLLGEDLREPARPARARAARAGAGSLVTRLGGAPSRRGPARGRRDRGGGAAHPRRARRRGLARPQGGDVRGARVPPLRGPPPRAHRRPPHRRRRPLQRRGRGARRRRRRGHAAPGSRAPRARPRRPQARGRGPRSHARRQGARAARARPRGRRPERPAGRRRVDRRALQRLARDRRARAPLPPRGRRPHRAPLGPLRPRRARRRHPVGPPRAAPRRSDAPSARARRRRARGARRRARGARPRARLLVRSHLRGRALRVRATGLRSAPGSRARRPPRGLPRRARPPPRRRRVGGRRRLRSQGHRAPRRRGARRRAHDRRRARRPRRARPRRRRAARARTARCSGRRRGGRAPRGRGRRRGAHAPRRRPRGRRRERRILQGAGAGRAAARGARTCAAHRSARALYALGSLGDAEDLALAETVFLSAEGAVAYAAESALGALACRHSAAARELAADAEGATSRARAAAVMLGALAEARALGAGEPGALRFLSQAAVSDDAATRRASVAALARLGGRTAVEVLMYALADEEREVRRTAARGLGRLAATGDDARLLGVVRASGDPELLAAAVRAAGDVLGAGEPPWAGLHGGRPLPAHPGGSTSQHLAFTGAGPATTVVQTPSISGSSSLGPGRRPSVRPAEGPPSSSSRPPPPSDHLVAALASLCEDASADVATAALDALRRAPADSPGRLEAMARALEHPDVDVVKTALLKLASAVASAADTDAAPESNVVPPSLPLPSDVRQSIPGDRQSLPRGAWEAVRKCLHHDLAELRSLAAESICVIDPVRGREALVERASVERDTEVLAAIDAALSAAQRQKKGAGPP